MTFHWLVGASSLCLLIGSALLLWGYLRYVAGRDRRPAT